MALALAQPLPAYLRPPPALLAPPSLLCSELWSCRWNLVGGSRFRTLVYEPACHGLFVAEQPQPGANAGIGASAGAAVAGAPAGRRASRRRRAAAMCATFAMSGAMHELCFWYLTRRLSGGLAEGAGVLLSGCWSGAGLHQAAGSSSPAHTSDACT